MRFSLIFFFFLLQEVSIMADMVNQPDLQRRQTSAWPLKKFAPYVDILAWPTPDIAKIANQIGHKRFTLAFVVSGSDSQPAWGGVIPMSENFYASQISALRKAGGDVIVSFGGANGQEIALVIKDPILLAAAYMSVIDRYNISMVDFDIEGAAIADVASVDIRNQALKIIKDKKPSLVISYTLPTLPNGLTQDGVDLLKSAVKFAAPIQIINIMTMDYGAGAAPNGATGMGGYAISAAKAVYSQAQAAGLKTFEIGVTPMIGVNDVAGEIFRLEDARQLLDFARQAQWIGLLSYWSINRDTSAFGPLYKSSQITQMDFEFAGIFKNFDSTGVSQTTTKPVSPPTPSPSSGPQSTDVPILYGYNWGSRIFAPYVDTGANASAAIRNASLSAGVTHFVIGSVIAQPNGTLSFAGGYSMASNYLAEQIIEIRMFGGDIILSFGGPTGQEPAMVIGNLGDLQQAYQNVADQYAASWLDFDIPNIHLPNVAGNERRARSIAAFLKENPFLKISFTLPCTTSGLSQEAKALIQKTLEVGANIDVINIKTSNFGTLGSSAGTGMGDAAITAAQATRQQILSLGLTTATIGITPTIGQNQISTEIFRLEDAQKVIDFAKTNGWISLLSFWSLQRDTLYRNANYKQDSLAFSSQWVQFEN